VGDLEENSQQGSHALDLALSKGFLSPAGHKGREHTGKNYHQKANNNPRKLPDSDQ
jgi:hypothetical protein